MQRIFNVDKWSTLNEGEALAFSNPRIRNVRLEVNAPVKSALWYVDADGETRFLALVEGRDTIEFGTTGSFSITVEGSPVDIYTADGDDISSIVLGAQSFVKIVERRRRNPELEHIAAVMQRNMEVRLEQQAHELEQLFIRRSEAASAAVAATAPAIGAGGSEPAPAPEPVASDPPAAGAGDAATGAVGV